jgi:hypothetical protein
MRIYGKFKFNKHYVFPVFSALDVEENDILYRWYQFSWFGKTLNFKIKSKKSKKSFFLKFF